MSAAPASLGGDTQANVSVQVVRDLEVWRTVRAGRACRGKRIGFVPTMGALHAGHAALLRRCRAENDLSVLSVFVNPTQFDDPADLRVYPQTFEQDRQLAAACGVDYLLAPSYRALYPDDYRYQVSERELSRHLCGAHRPGHFDGVLTVVLKLLNLVGADAAYFGEKDWQQLQLVAGLARAFFLPTAIVACPTVREPDGLALSSRNARLAPAARAVAAAFPRILASAPDPAVARDRLAAAGLEVDYVEQRDGRRLGAVRVGGVRLIDNLPWPQERGVLPGEPGGLPATATDLGTRGPQERP